jgi:gluconolactonase
MIHVLLLAAVTTIDLATPEGVARVKGQWRYADARVVETDFRAAGHDNQPTGAPVKTLDIAPHAGSANFDDAGWQIVPADALAARRGSGRLCFAWYRINITVPDDLAGSDVAFSTSVDDYAEIWVDGELARSPGAMITGWNAENKLVVGRNVKAGQKIQLAIFGANGPLSNPPTNYIWMRYAKLEFTPTTGVPVAVTPVEVNVVVVRNDPALDAIVPANPKIYKLADGFTFTEGPVWVKDHLLFSDPNENRIYRYDGKLTVFREKSGYEGADIAEYRQPGSNGLTLDKDGRLTINQHGNRRVVRLEKDGSLTVLADKFEGKRLNSPNDLVYRRDGALFFTDPFFGLPKFDKDPRKELPHQGVYALIAGKLKLVTKELTGPNGIAFSPDEKYLYVGNWQDDRKVVMRYAVNAAGDVTESKVFFDMTGAKGEDAIDGVNVDQAGNLYVSGPGGLWILSPAGKHLGTIRAPRHVHNMAWGDEDGRTLYLCARDKLYRIRLNIPGIRP